MRDRPPRTGVRALPGTHHWPRRGSQRALLLLQPLRRAAWRPRPDGPQIIAARPRRPCVTRSALMGPLAGILLVTGGGAALQADFLAAAFCLHLDPLLGLGGGGAFSVGFRDDFVAHEMLSSW